MADAGITATSRPGWTLAKQELLEQRLRGKSLAASQPSEQEAWLKPNPAAAHDPFPLTEVQQAYWLGRSQGLTLGNVAAHVYMEVETRNLDAERMGLAVHCVIERHPMLRAIVQHDGTQRILPQVPPYQIEAVDLRLAGAADIQAELAGARRHLSHQIFDTAQWPLFHIRITRLPDRDRLHFSFDLLVMDAWSLQIFFRDLALFYTDPAAMLPSLEITFRDYMLSEAQRPGRNLSRSEEYWTALLDDLPPAPELPLAVRPESLRLPLFKRVSSRLEPQAWHALKKRAETIGLSPSAVLLTAFTDILRAWSTSPRFTLNLTVFERLPVHPQVQELIGDFTRTLLLAVDSPQAAFQDRALELHRRLLDGLDHRDLNGIEVLRRLARLKGAAAAHMPVVFTSAMHLESASARSPVVSGPGLPGEVVYSISQTPQVWLDHQVSEQAGALIFNWDVVDGLFPGDMLAKMFAGYCAWLECLSEDPAVWRDGAKVPVISAEDLAGRNTGAEDAPIPEGLLTDGALSQVLIRPEHTALVFSSMRLTYAELERRVATLATELRRLGARPNSRVAVSMRKGWEQVVATLAAVRSGAAYVPIDPDLPRERLHGLLLQSEVEIVLTLPVLASTIDWPQRLRIVTVGPEDALDETIPVDAAQSPADLAYVIYTSGSTGEPKGVMIDHRSALNTIADINRRFAVGPSDRILALSSLSFDLSVYDLFGVLAAGGTVVVPEPESARDPLRWLDWMHLEHITIWNSVPALMEMLVEAASADPRGLPPSLRLVMLSGDWIPVSLPERIRALAPQAKIYGLGGATEASIWSIAYEIGPVDPGWKSIPYGRPLANQQFHVLNAALEACPDYVPGELYIGGAGLARGYWRDEARTRERFISHPQYGRLYCTGDLGRYRSDGVIEFLGRQDTQVKVQGYRVELGEIEAALLRHPNVREAVVQAPEDEAGHRHLVGFVVASDEPGSTLFEEEQFDANTAEARWHQLVTAAHGRSLHLPAEFDAAMAATAHGERFSSAWMRRSLADLGVFLSAGERHTAHSIEKQIGLAPRCRKLFRQWLGALVEDGALVCEGDQFTAVDSFGAADPDRLWEEIQHFASTNESGVRLLDYLRRSVHSLPALLRGEADPLEILFPGGAAQIAEGIYELNFAARYFNSIAAEAVGAFANSVKLDERLTAIEVGAGVGACTSALLPHLPADRTRYAYTDVSPYFLAMAKEKFSRFPFVDYGLLDINRAPETQGWPAHAFDIVVANQVLHDARDLRAALHHMRRLLAPGGMLLMVESSRYSRLQMITVGFLEGFSEYADERLITGTPLLPPRKWERLLQECGFGPTSAFPHPESRGAALAQHVIVAAAPPVVRRFREEDLAAFLREILPAYMIPARFIELPAMPHTANGKIDRKALRMPERMRTAVSADAAPRNPVESALTEIWSEVLGLERVGIHSNFFEIGGDSLLAIQIVTRAGRHGLNVRPQQIFECQTIAGLAEALADSETVAPADQSAAPPASASIEIVFDSAELDDIAAELGIAAESSNG